MPINSHNKTGVTPVWPLATFDPSIYLKRETDTVPDERKGQATAINAVLLEIQRMQQVLGTLPGWVEGDTYTDLILGNIIYGDGSAGDVTITGGTTTLVADTYYDNLTVDGTGILDTDGYRVFVRGTLTVETGGIIRNNGLSSTTGTGAAGADASTLGDGTAGGNFTAAGTNQTDGFGGDPPPGE